MMSEETATTEKKKGGSSKPSVPKMDFSKYAVGQEYEGKLIGAKQFGVFVDISTGTNVLLPRSVMSKGNFEKLKKMAEEKSADLIKLEIVGVSAENQTLSGKFLPANYKERADISALAGKEMAAKTLAATVISTHDFGIFVALDDFGVEGLVPASKLPSRDNIKDSYK